VPAAQLVDRHGRGRVAGHHQSFDVVLRQQMLGNRMAALADEGFAFFAVGRVCVVSDVDKALVGQLFLQGLQHAQPANAAVKHADRTLVGGHLGVWLRRLGKKAACAA